MFEKVCTEKQETNIFKLKEMFAEIFSCNSFSTSLELTEIVPFCSPQSYLVCLTSFIKSKKLLNVGVTKYKNQAIFDLFFL